MKDIACVDYHLWCDCSSTCGNSSYTVSVLLQLLSVASQTRSGIVAMPHVQWRNVFYRLLSDCRWRLGASLVEVHELSNRWFTSNGYGQRCCERKCPQVCCGLVR